MSNDWNEDGGTMVKAESVDNHGKSKLYESASTRMAHGSDTRRGGLRPEIIPVEPDPDHAGEGNCEERRSFFVENIPPFKPSSAVFFNQCIRIRIVANLALKAAENLTKIRETIPLIHNITNYVVMNYTANALLSMGASPVMAHAENEVEEMVSFAGALVLNIGTLSDPWIQAMIKAGTKARELGVPVILDPVGSGATTFRTRTAHRIIREAGVTLIRGNASEILSLQQGDAHTRGVDAIHTVEDAAKMASALASELHATIAITGPEDIVTDGTRAARILGGHPLMARVTGTGCSATAIAGAFSAVDPDPFTAACSALAFFGLAGKKAGEHASAPGSFMIALLDALYTLTPDELAQEGRIIPLA